MLDIDIRPLREEDAKISFKWRNDPEIWRYTGSRPDHEITINDELNWIRKAIGDTSRRSFAILADGTYVGNTYLTDIKQGAAEFHIFIGDRDFWGKGIARQASNLIIDFGRNELKLKRINLGVKRDNAAAFHLYQSLGFQETGEEDGFVRMSLDLVSER